MGGEDAGENISMHIEDTSANPPRVMQFTLPTAAGESVTEYYARLRAAIKTQLEKNR